MPRPRSSEAHQKVLRAALTLFSERGIESASMDAIARSSGVSKATIYNHWPDKESLLMEVVEMIHGLDRPPEHIDSGDLLTDLTWILTRKPPGEFETERTRLTSSIISYAKLHDDFGRAWRSRAMEPARKAIANAIVRAIERGQIPAGLEYNLAEAMLLGPMVYAHIFQSERNAAHPEIGVRVADAFVRAHAMPATAANANPSPSRSPAGAMPADSANKKRHG